MNHCNLLHLEFLAAAFQSSAGLSNPLAGVRVWCPGTVQDCLSKLVLSINCHERAGRSVFRPCGVGRRPAQRRDNSAAASFRSTWQHTWLTRNLPVGAGGAWGAPRNLGSTTTVNAKWAGRVAGCCQQDKGPTLGQALKVRLFPFFPVVSATGFWGAQTLYGFRRQYGRRIGRSWSLRRNWLKGTLVCG